MKWPPSQIENRLFPSQIKKNRPKELCRWTEIVEAARVQTMFGEDPPGKFSGQRGEKPRLGDGRSPNSYYSSLQLLHSFSSMVEYLFEYMDSYYH